MTIKADLNYIEFNNTKETLEPGYYRVTEADGDISIAKVERRSWERNATITWKSEDEYLELVRQDADLDEQLMESWDRAMSRGDDEFRRIDPEDLAETDRNNELEAAHWRENRELASDAGARNVEQKTPSLADLLRDAMAGNVEFSEPLAGHDGGFAVDEAGLEAEQDDDDIPGTDPRDMSDTQYDQLCETVEQNRRDGMI